MKIFFNKKIAAFLVVAVLPGMTATFAQTVTRGPYLQAGKQDSITIRWRTNTATNSKITWGNAFVASPGTYTNSFTQDVATPVTEHIVRIGGLTADTKYWYSIGSTTVTLQQTSGNYFLTLPPDNTTRKLRFLAIGDCGTNTANQVNVKNTFLNYIGSNDPDAMILLGDNAYSYGTDAEYQSNFFDIYKDDLLLHYKLYPAPGNHDYGNDPIYTGNTGAPGASMPYHNNFTVPSAGEIGGVPSGAKNYYAYNIGSVHFVSLDTYGKGNGNTTNVYDTSGAQATWLKNDLAANTQRWTVVYFHHPPYTKTSHSSDTELDLVAIRENLNAIFERFGVDLVICGHAHGYERSYLLKHFYNNYAAPLSDADFVAAIHTATGNTQNALYDGVTGNNKAYTYNSGKYVHGTVYIVAGSAGQIGGTAGGYPQDCMYYTNSSNGGCFYFEVDNNRLDAKFISYVTAPTPVVADKFTIFKDVKKKSNYSIILGQSVTLAASWPGTYNWTIPVNGFTPPGQTTRSISATPDAVGTYNYYVADNFGDLKDTFVVTVNSVVLPVQLRSFTATLQHEHVLLNWSTEQEQHSKYFSIERSVDGNNFSLLGTINAAGTSTTIRDYQLKDPSPATGWNYYRLSQTDQDGRRSYFETRTIHYRPGITFGCKIGQPAAGQVKLFISSPVADNLMINVTDMAGRKIISRLLKVPGGNSSSELDLQQGVYIITLINSAGERINLKTIMLSK